MVWPGDYTLQFSRGHGEAVEERVHVDVARSGPSDDAQRKLIVRKYPARRID